MGNLNETSQKKAKIGTTIRFGDGRLTAEVIEELEDGGRILEFSYDGIS